MAFPRSTVLRRTTGLSLAAASAFLVSGCVSITASSSSQLDVVGDAQVVLDLCQDESWGGAPAGRVPVASPCISSEYTAAGYGAQVFLTYLIPTAAGAPERLAASDGVTGEFVQTPSDVAALTDGHPAPDGYKWVSYRSTPTPPLQVNETGPRAAKVTAKFDVRGLQGSFDYGVIAAFRWASTAGDPGDFAADRPVVCGETGGYDINVSGIVPTGGTNCSDSVAPVDLFGSVTTGRIIAPPGGPATPTPTPTPGPAPTPTPTPTPTPAPGTVFAGEYTLASIALSRLTVTAPATATATAGTPARVTFSQTSSLAAGATSSSVPVTGSTTIPGATVSTDASLTIGSTGGLTADVTIPASTPAGEYPVTIEVGARTGRRTATTTLKVSAAPAPTPTPTAGAPTPTPKPKTIPEQLADTADSLQDIVQRAKKVNQLREGAMTVPVFAPAAGTVRVSIVGRKKIRGRFPTIAVGSEETKAAGKVDVTVKRTPYGRELLRSGEPVPATLVVRLFSKTGKTVTTGLPITLD